MKKSTIKIIDAIAENLPIDMYVAQKDRVSITGEDLLLGEVKEVEGVPVDKEKTYIQEMPIQISKNHKRRMKRAFNKNGVSGVVHYLRTYTPPENHSLMEAKVLAFFKM